MIVLRNQNNDNHSRRPNHNNRRRRNHPNNVNDDRNNNHNGHDRNGSNHNDNSHNNDNIIVTMFKGTTTDDNASLNNIGLTRIGTTFAPTMARRKTYVVNQNLTSNNQMSAGEGLIITAHVTSHTSTSYPNILITLDGQYR